MIKKSFELDKINFENYNLYLFYGENEGFKNEIIKKKFENNYNGKIHRYEEKEILENKNTFFNGIFTKSFFEDTKLIIISRISDKIKDVIEEITLREITDVKIILLAGSLEKKSKIRNFFEKGKNIICIPFYSDSLQTLSYIAIKFFKEKKISISQQLINLIIERSKGDRKNLNNELNKIENFSKNKKKIEAEDILKLTNLAENYNASELADNCLTKNVKKTSNILNENNYSNEDCILIVRTLLNKTKRLLKLKEVTKNNENIDQAVTNFKPPIFWKDKETVKNQISKWSLTDIEKLIYKINDIELLIKINSLNSLNITSDFLINTAASNTKISS